MTSPPGWHSCVTTNDHRYCDGRQCSTAAQPCGETPGSVFVRIIVNTVMASHRSTDIAAMARTHFFVRHFDAHFPVLMNGRWFLVGGDDIRCGDVVLGDVAGEARRPADDR